MKKTNSFTSLLSAVTVVTFVTVAAGQSDVPLLISYQGELKSPTTGDPVRDGRYDMVFEIFNRETTGVSLWRGKHTDSNRNPVEVKNGIFNVILGSGAGNALDTSVFKRPDAWLEITIEGETLQPRQRITSAAYSMVSDNSRLFDGKTASEFLTLTDNDSFAAGQGAQASHQGTFVWADSTGDPLASTADNQFLVRANGGATFDVGDQAMQVNGDIQAERIVYSSPRTHYYSVGGEDFVPGTSTSEYENHAMGAYIHSGSGTMVAPVHLPHGAVVTEFKVFFADNSVSKITVNLRRFSLTYRFYMDLATLDSSGISGYDSKTETSISSGTIHNTANAYLVSAYADPWDGVNMKIIGAVITYTTTEAP